MTIPEWLFKVLVGVVTKKIDENADAIIGRCALEADGRNYKKATVTNQQIAELLAGRVRESNFLGDSEDRFYLFCIEELNINWGERIKNQMAA